MILLLFCAACGSSGSDIKVLVNGKPEALEETEVRARLADGRLTDSSMVWGGGRWIPFREDARYASLKPAPASAEATVATPASTVSNSARLELHYVPSEVPMGLSTSEGGGPFFDTPDANTPLKLPPDDGKRTYGVMTIGGKDLAAALESGDQGKLWLDGNGNGDLTDDGAPITGEAQGVLPNHYTLPLGDPPGSAPYRLWMFESRMGGVKYYAAGHWAGTFPLLADYPVVLFDGTADFDYANDPVVIDFNRDGKADETEMKTVGQFFELQGRRMTVSAIDPNGKSVTFSY